jgi:hypothetical protein
VPPGALRRCGLGVARGVAEMPGRVHFVILHDKLFKNETVRLRRGLNAVGDALAKSGAQLEELSTSSHLAHGGRESLLSPPGAACRNISAAI